MTNPYNSFKDSVVSIEPPIEEISRADLCRVITEKTPVHEFPKIRFEQDF